MEAIYTLAGTPEFPEIESFAQNVDMTRSGLQEVGEDNMMSFFRSYMTSILKPFADNVDELHKVSISIADNVQELKSRTDAHDSLASEQGALLDGLRADLDRTTEQANATQTLLESTVAKQAELEADYQASKPKLHEHGEALQALDSAVEELRQTLKDTRVKVAKCQDANLHHDVVLLQIKPSIENLTTDLASLQQSHEQSISEIKSSLADNLPVLHKLAQEQLQQLKDHIANFDSNNEKLEPKFRMLDDRIAEVQKLNEHQQEHQQRTDASVQQLKERVDAHDGENNTMKERLNAFEVSLTDHDARAAGQTEQIRSFIMFEEEVRNLDIPGLKEAFAVVQKDADQQRAALKKLHLAIYGDPVSEVKNTIEVLQEDAVLASARCDRLDQVFGIEPLTKENLHMQNTRSFSMKGGVVLTNEQIDEFQEIFNRFDVDSSGNITQAELGNVLQSLGLDVSEAVVSHMLEEMDADHSGEINFDELCTIMAKMLGPDGKANIDGALNSVATMMSEKEAFENETRDSVATVKEHAKQIVKNRELIDVEHERLSSTDLRVDTLEGNFANLFSEVRKLREGLELNKEYWKGFSRGIKETHKTVHTEGEGEMLPNATRLRNALPPLASRPATVSGNMTAR